MSETKDTSFTELLLRRAAIFVSLNWEIGRNRAKFTPGGIDMTDVVFNRRNLLAAGG